MCFPFPRPGGLDLPLRKPLREKYLLQVCYKITSIYFLLQNTTLKSYMKVISYNWERQCFKGICKKIHWSFTATKLTVSSQSQAGKTRIPHQWGSLRMCEQPNEFSVSLLVCKDLSSLEFSILPEVKSCLLEEQRLHLTLLSVCQTLLVKHLYCPPNSLYAFSCSLSTSRFP